MKTGCRILLRVLWCALACVCLPGPALAQTSGSLRGILRDDAGNPLAGATVVVRSSSNKIGERAAISDSTGSFQIGSLPAAADYSLHATFPGFAGLDLSDIQVHAGQTTRLHLTLQASTSYRERIQVRATPDVVNLENTTTETRLSSEFIDALPILGRNYQDILTLAPGVTDVDGDGNPNIHGARDTDVITFVDGVNTTDPLTGKIGAQLNIESIQEIEIKTSGATAEFGRAQGGFANIITKSGGNAFKGTFKLFWRGSLLDGDGAGTDDPSLHGGLGEIGLRDLRFDDYLPFLSLEGPIVKDRAWFFLANEFIQEQTPINAVNTAFIAGTRELREFGKFTWQMSASNRLALSFNFDPQRYSNQGLNSFTKVESGFEDRAGGMLVAARTTSVLTPNVALETTLSYFDGHPQRIPNEGLDLNGNGLLFRDLNGDGFHDYIERDFGQDWDGDGVWDVFEPRLNNGRFNGLHDDRDGDGRRTLPGECEGLTREDLDCDGHLDNVNEDLNHNGHFDIGEVDLDGDGHLDLGNEDRNHNGMLDDTPRPVSLYPYGELRPEGPDWDYSLNQSTGTVTGPFYQAYDDQRMRATVRQDLSLYVPDRHGTHDVKMGFSFEHEGFTRTTDAHEIVGSYVPPHDAFPPYAPNHPRYGKCGAGSNYVCPEPIRVVALLPTQDTFDGDARGLTAGMYAQNTYKPLPNLSIGLGLRFDRETTEAPGFTYFDPGATRAQFDRLNALIGTEGLYSDDVLVGNGDGIISKGILGDPMFRGTANVPQTLAPITDVIRAAMPTLMIRNHHEVQFGSAPLASLLPDVIRNGRIDNDALDRLGVEIQRPETFRLANNNLAPRLSVSWDPRADGKTKLFGTWGRYYDKLFLSTIIGEQGPDYVTRYYMFSNLAYRDIIQPHHEIGGPISSSPPSAVQIDRGLATPFSDEYTFGFQRELAPEMALSVTFIDRHFRKQLQDIDVNHTLHYDRNGKPVDLLGHQAVIVDDTQGGFTQTIRVPDGRPDLFVNDLYFNQILRIGNFNQASYKGLEIELKRRLARRWQLQGSYVYSRALGNAEDFQSRLGNDPSSQEFEGGYLGYDQRHVVKLNALMYLPGDWQVGSNVTWSSGLPYSIISRFFALDNSDYQQFRTRYGFTDYGAHSPVFVPVRRNSLRNDPELDINLQARKTVVIGRTTAALSFEVFNLLNSDDLRVISYEPTPDASAASINVFNPTVHGPLQVDSTRRFGRRFQLGIQFDF